MTFKDLFTWVTKSWPHARKPKRPHQFYGRTMQNFFGRKSEIEQLKKWERPGETIVVGGSPGAGKSALCKHVWDDAIWLDAQFWVGDIQQAFYSALSFSLELFWKGDVQFVQDYLKDLKHVIIIDNAEYIDGKHLSNELNVIESECVWVITTRRAQDFENSTFHNLKLGALGSAKSSTAAKMLFLENAGESISDPLLETLLAQLDYHPMSIQLCATMTRWAGAKYIRDLIQKKEAGSIAPELWPLASLGNIFMNLWMRLNDETRFFLERISQMQMPISMPDLLVLFGNNLDFNAVMEEATAYCLVEINQENDVKWLQMTQALRVFCGEQFNIAPKNDNEWSKSLLAFAFNKHKDIWIHWECLDSDEKIESVRADRLMLTRLLRLKRSFFSASEITELGLLVCVSNLANETMFEVIDLLREINDYSEGNCGWQSAHLNCEILLYELSATLDEKTIDRLETLDQKISLTTEHASVRLQWKIATQLVWAKALRNEITEAKMIINKMQKRAEVLDRKNIRIPFWLTARFEMRIGSLFHVSGDRKKAVHHYKRTTNIARKDDDRRSLIMASNNLGVLYSDQCDLELSRQYLDEAKNSRFLGSSFRSMNLLSSGMVYLREGSPIQARGTFNAAGELMARTHQRSSLSLIELNLCMVAIDEEDIQLARHHLKRVQISERVNDPMLDLSVYLMECVILTYEGALKEAWNLSEEKREMSLTNSLLSLALCFYTTSLVCLIVEDKLNKADEYLKEARSKIDKTEIHLMMILDQAELFILMKRSRSGKIKEQQSAYLVWLKTERDTAFERQHLKSESVRTVQYSMRKALIGKELGFWTLFNRHDADVWRNHWLVDEGSGYLCSPEGKWIDLSRNQQLMELLKTLVFHDKDQVISLESFATKLWPDQTLHPDSVNNRIHVALSKLRTLGCNTWIERHNEGYRLDIVQKWVWMEGTKIHRSD